PGKSGASLAALDDLSSHADERLVATKARNQQLGIADYCGEQVIEIVGHAAGQAADCLELLSLEESLLEFNTIGYVLSRGDDIGAVSSGVTARGNYLFLVVAPAAFLFVDKCCAEGFTG